MTGNVSRPGSTWPFIAGAGDAQASQAPGKIRERAIALLRTEKRAIHTGELATLLGVLTHQVQVAMHEPLRDNAVRFSSSDGWELVPPSAPIQTRDDAQGAL